MVIIIAGIVQYNTGLRAAILAGVQEMMAASRAEEGCLAYTFSADLTAPDTLHLFEIWASEEVLEAHRQSAHMAEFRRDTIPHFRKLDIKRYVGEPTS